MSRNYVFFNYKYEVNLKLINYQLMFTIHWNKEKNAYNREYKAKQGTIIVFLT